jgi:drug/metabolite transporter (DMT)-like permease
MCAATLGRTMHRVMRRRYSALGFATACWGTAAAATKLGLSAFRPATQLLVELVFATIFLWLPVAAIGQPPRVGSLRTYAMLALLDPALPFLLILIGLRSSTAANAALLVSVESFVAVGFAVVIGTERVTRAFAAGAVLAAAGALLVSSGGTSAFALGDLLFLAATVPLGLAVVFARRVAPSTPSSEITRYQTGFATAIVVPCAAVEWLLTGGPTMHHADAGAWCAAVYAGVIGLAMSNLTFNFALGKLSATTAGLALNLVPLIGVVTAIAALGEHLTAAEAVGGVLIILGLALPSFGGQDVRADVGGDVRGSARCARRR